MAAVPVPARALSGAAFGTLLIIGFTLHNATEGLAIIAPMAKDRPSVWTLVKLGLIGGVPTIAGAWIGGLVYSRPFTVFFLGLGVGAIAQVVVLILRQMARELAQWFPQHAQTMDAALALHLRSVGFDVDRGTLAAPERLPEAQISGCGSGGCSPVA